MTFPYKSSINKCIGSCHNKNNPYFKTCFPNSIKNITVKSLDLISNEYIFMNIFLKILVFIKIVNANVY